MFLAIIGRIVDISMAILALAKQLYGAESAGLFGNSYRQSFDHGDTPSALAVRGLPCLVTKVDARPQAFDSTAGFLRTKRDVESLMQGQV
jgi:hypothetical protein